MPIAKSKPIRSKKIGKCKSLIKDKIRKNITEYKNGKFVSRAKAIAVAYSQVYKNKPYCRRYLKRKSTSRKSVPRKSTSRKSVPRKSVRRKSTSRKSVRRKYKFGEKCHGNYRLKQLINIILEYMYDIPISTKRARKGFPMRKITASVPDAIKKLVGFLNNMSPTREGEFVGKPLPDNSEPPRKITKAEKDEFKSLEGCLQQQIVPSYWYPRKKEIEDEKRSIFHTVNNAILTHNSKCEQGRQMQLDNIQLNQRKSHYKSIDRRNARKKANRLM